MRWAYDMMTDLSPRAGVLGRRFIDIHREYSYAILRIVEAGWRRASGAAEVHTGAGEVEITEHLRKGMRVELAMRAGAWYKKITVLPGTESLSTPDARRPDGRTDIPVFFQDIREEYDEHDPHAIIECKRVTGGDTGLCRLYIVKGVDRFKTGQYASNHAVGFMAGYLLSGDGASASTGINAYLTGKGRCSEHLQSAGSTDAPAGARSSRHGRPAPAEPIILHHVFLTLRTCPVASGSSAA